MQKSSWGEQDSAPRRGKWSSEEIDLLKELYGFRDVEAIACQLQRSPASVRHMVGVVFSGATRTGYWTEVEVQRLKRFIGVASLPVIARILRRTKADVRKKIVELGVEVHTGPWTPLEIQELKRLYGTRTDEDLSSILSRSLDSVREVAHSLCLAKDKAFLRRVLGDDRSTAMPRWRKEELVLLQRLYPTHSNLEIAQRLDRSVKSVVSKAHHLGLKKDPVRLREMGRENVKLRYVRDAEE